MIENQNEVHEQDVEIRTAIKAGDDGSQMGTGSATGSQMGTGSAIGGGTAGSGH